MDRIAIDVVIIPPDAIMDLCIQINQEAFKNNKGRFKMSKTDFIPHISLAIGCIDEKNIDEILNIITEICNNAKPFNISIIGIKHYERKDGNRASFQVKVSKELRSLHETILSKLSKFFVACGSSDALIDGDITGISETSKTILNNYERSYSRENYNPHITLCCYDATEFCKEIKFPISFKANRIAFCHVGDGCTCRKVLYSSSTLL